MIMVPPVLKSFSGFTEKLLPFSFDVNYQTLFCFVLGEKMGMFVNVGVFVRAGSLTVILGQLLIQMISCIL